MHMLRLNKGPLSMPEIKKDILIQVSSPAHVVWAIPLSKEV